MSRETSIRLRLGAFIWLGLSLFFATNVVREHYPAFALIDKGNFQVDEYLGLHSDIFLHRDGHAYIGNQVFGSVVAAVPLFLFDPLLDALEAKSRTQLKATEASATTFASEYPNRREFMRKVRERGLELRFGAACAITTTFVMTLLSSLLSLSLFKWLRDRQTSVASAVGLTLLFAFATPILYRSAFLNHNLMLLATVWWGFVALAGSDGPSQKLSFSRRFLAGFASGLSLALDYAGLVPLLCLFAWLVFERRREVGWASALRDSIAFVAGTIPGVLFLLFSQWSMYGHPFWPGQHWMPAVNFTDRGFRGMSWPAPDLFWENLVSPNFGLFAFAPLLLLALWPRQGDVGPKPVLNASERRFAWIFVLTFLIFCAANQYSRMQWNSGFRYLLPVLPFVFLLAAAQLRRMRPKTVIALAIPSVIHGVVLSMVRFTPVDFDDSRTAVGESWRRFLHEGPQLPWLSSLSQAYQDLAKAASGGILPLLLLAVVLAVGWWWLRPGRLRT